MNTSQAQIVDYCLKNCLFDSWSTELLEKASISAGLDKNYWKIDFPGGTIDVIDYFNQQCNETLANELRINDLRTSEKIRTAIKYRIGMNNQYKSQLQSMLGVYALHPIQASKSLYETVDTIWRLAGDTTTDWNFYSKRLLLAGVYSSTFLFWLNDKSDGYAKTWEFLDRRLSEIGKFGKGIGQIKNKIKTILPAQFA